MKTTVALRERLIYAAVATFGSIEATATRAAFSCAALAALAICFWVWGPRWFAPVCGLFSVLWAGVSIAMRRTGLTLPDGTIAADDEVERITRIAKKVTGR